jgi:hypothetical protein
MIVQVIERTEGHYDVQEVEFGTVYRWCPDCVLVECDCGETLTLTGSETTCVGCGTDHAAVVQKKLAARRLKDETAHPWRYAGDHKGTGMPF